MNIYIENLDHKPITITVILDKKIQKLIADSESLINTDIN